MRGRGEVTAQLRRAGHLLGGWYRLEGGGWGTRCARCGHVVHITPSRVIGLRGGPCVPNGSAVASWRLYNVGRSGLLVDRYFHSSLPCSDPWSVVFADNSYLYLSEDPTVGAQWGEGWDQDDDTEISFAELPGAVRRYLLEETNPMDAKVWEIFEKPIPIYLACGFLGRFDHEDTGRLRGGGVGVGIGACDYPDHCPARGTGWCRFFDAD